jgi:release factor glutamine methyltransferase
MAENLIVKPGDLVLELGTGCGLISLVAARTARKVVATDLSPDAVRLATYNIQLNHFEGKIEVRQGRLFEPVQVEERFDLILFNPPYLPLEREGCDRHQAWLETAWNGGPNGRCVIDPFIRGCKDFLRPRGAIQMVQSSLSGFKQTSSLLTQEGFNWRVTASAPSFFEKILLITAELGNP